MANPSPTRADRDETRWLGHAAFALSLVSTVVYFSTSLGIRHFVAFLLDGLGRVLRIFGHGG